MAMKYRLRVAAFDTPHMVKFVAAMRTIQGFKDNRSYHKIAGFHGAIVSALASRLPLPS